MSRFPADNRMPVVVVGAGGHGRVVLDILKRTLRPAFLARLLWDLAGALVTPSRGTGTKVETVGELDK